MPSPDDHRPVVTGPTPDGLLEAFWAYEAALMDDDLAAMDVLFEAGPQTLRGDGGGLLVGHDTIGEFRRIRHGAPARRIVAVEVRTVGPADALVVAVTEPLRGGRGLQTQLWRRGATGWHVRAAHVSAPPATFDGSVWRVVGDPLVAGGTGSLSGESVAVKDLFAVRGQPVGAGVPQYLSESPVAPAHAAAVQRLLAAGASVRGIARTDQFAYSLAGDNEHYGTPVNPLVPGGLPGGSSSGCATAVSLGAATIGLATDTAGSVRVPASYQGLWGLRTTHGSVPTGGLIALAPDFDSVGLLTRTADLLGRAAAVLLGEQDSARLGSTLVTAPDLLSLATPAVQDAFSSWLATSATLRASATVSLPDVASIAESFRIHQAWQAWQVHGAWIRSHPDALRGAARSRFQVASTITPDENAAAAAALADAGRRVDDALDGRVLVLPSAASVAPRLWDSAEEVDRVRAATMRLTCLAGLTGRPAVSAPLLEVAGGPVGVCLVGPRGSDRALVELVSSLA
jgi:Asp-tRNA(Asn)/Glu-tRNA(Gln) amidotransferase A subunit family amidase